MVRGISGRRSLALLGVPLWAVGSAYGQFNDGNMDALTIGTPPDCQQAAGAWQFPPAYVTALSCEVDPTAYTIVATSSFDPTRTGNSLRVNSSANTVNDNYHVTNILTPPIMPTAGQIVRVQWELYVGATGGGATVYVGADMTGTAGYSNATDRGPQISWWGDGSIQCNQQGVNTPLVPVFPRGAWQTARVDIHLDTQLFDFYWAPTGQPLQLIMSGLHFRIPPTAPVIDRVERFSIAHFGGTIGLDVSNVHYDNVTIALVSPGPICYPDCNADHALNVNDFICFQGAFAANNIPLADCNHDNTLNVNDFICFQSAFAAGCSQL